MLLLPLLLDYFGANSSFLLLLLLDHCTRTDSMPATLCCCCFFFAPFSIRVFRSRHFLYSSFPIRVSAHVWRMSMTHFPFSLPFQFLKSSLHTALNLLPLWLYSLPVLTQHTRVWESKMAAEALATCSLPLDVASWATVLRRALRLKLEELPIPEHFFLKNMTTGCRFSHLRTPPTVAGKRKSAVLVLLSPVAGVAPQGFQEMCITLTKRTAHLRYHGNEMSFPGGGLDDGESVVGAAQRETAEEIGVNNSAYEVSGTLQSLAPVSGRSYVTPVVALAPSPVSPVCNSPNEVSSIHYLHLSPLLFNSGRTHCRLVKYLPSSTGSPFQFPCFFASPSQGLCCNSIVSPMRPAPTLREEGGSSLLLPASFPGELVWGVTAFIICELLLRLAAVFKVGDALGRGLDPMLTCSPIIARDSALPLGKL
uniref:Conserved NUDIX hydrolase n=1 Tax=Trypanosoma congolense (strain IL3000) TaxID=1068625 RepID=G0UW60_TRYCI|nr:conserved NUDIX hydrolase [Trypanosoma congolense IL3000]